MVVLYLFYKPSKVNPVGGIALFTERAYNDSIAENILYEWQSANTDIVITPEQDADNHLLDMNKLSKSEREFRESLADPSV